MSYNHVIPSFDHHAEMKEITKDGFNYYQNRAKETALYRNAVDSIDPGANAPNLRKLLKILYAGVGLGESGEVQGKIKKIVRDDLGQMFENRRDAIRKEIGDTLWYLAMVAEELGISLGDVAVENIERLASRNQRGTLQGDGDNR